jgi:hypothetical protein
MLNAQRGDGDRPGLCRPKSIEEYESHASSTTVMNNIYDRWGWRFAEEGLTQMYYSSGKRVEDTSEVPRQFVSYPIGLMFILNIDWSAGLL